jgi:hypothetical protein
MVITKDALINIANSMTGSAADIEDVFEKILISAKIEQALLESEQGLGQDWNEFKDEWLKEDL